MATTTFSRPETNELPKVEDSIAIVVNGDTAPKNISKGQYLFIKNHSTLATGGYHATAAIAKDANVTGNNTSPDADGIANSLNSKIAVRLKTKTVELSKDVCGTSWSPTSRNIGACSTLFGLSESAIVSIMARQASFSPAATASVGLYNGNVYVASSQNATLSSSIKFVIGYV